MVISLVCCYLFGNLRTFCEIQTGTRQRCPLFPFLIIVVLAILIRDIKQNMRNTKVKTKREVCKLRVFSDDLLVLDKPLKGTETLIEKLKQFATLANFR